MVFILGFAKIRDNFIDILEGYNVYVGLSDSQQDVIDEMREIW